MAWLDEHQPDDVANCLIHNDFRFDNVVLAKDDPTAVIGVLDWEMATLGDPLMDLGGTLAYWVQADDDAFFSRSAASPRNLPGMLTREEVVAYYCEKMGFTVTPEEWRFYEVYGLFRFAVIAQQIYYRYFHRQTTNEVFAFFGPAVHYYEQRCRCGDRRPALTVGQLLLVRHGQASWDSDDYDVLSAHRLGAVRGCWGSRSLPAGSCRTSRGSMGGMRRHRETARGLSGRAGCRGWLPKWMPAGTSSTTSTMLGSHPAPFEGRKPTKAEFQEWFEAATDTLDRGVYDDEYAESFGAFTDRVVGSMR